MKQKKQKKEKENALNIHVRLTGSMKTRMQELLTQYNAAGHPTNATFLATAAVAEKIAREKKGGNYETN